MSFLFSPRVVFYRGELAVQEIFHFIVKPSHVIELLLLAGSCDARRQLLAPSVGSHGRLVRRGLILPWRPKILVLGLFIWQYLVTLVLEKEVIKRTGAIQM